MMSNAAAAAPAVRNSKWKTFFDALLGRFDQRILRQLATQKRSITIGLICTAVASLTTPATMALASNAQNAITFLYQAYDLPRRGYPPDPTASAKGFNGLAVTCIAVIALFAFKYWFVRGQTYYLNKASSRLSANLRIQLLDKLLNLPVGYYNDRRTGTIQSILLNDVNVYQNAVGIIRDSVQGPISATAAFIAVFWIQWRVASIALILVPIIVAVIDRNQKKMRRAQKQVQESLADVSANTIELLNGIRVIKAFGAEENVRDNYHQLIEKTYESQLRASRITASLRPLTDLIGASGLAGAFALCGILAFRGMIDPGKVVGLVIGMDTINQGFRSLGSVANTFATVQAASERIHTEVLERDEEPELVGGRILDNPKGHIQFENVSFRYSDGTEALKNVSFEILPDTSLALVGPSGAGKSTIADLLLRFYDPTSGRILLDGVDIRELNITWLRGLVGVVPQQTFLFNGTVEENVRLGAPSASDEDLDKALEQASAKDFVTELSTRSNSELGERGIRLSGGQMQRVAIARALIKRPTILLLDEATSALDANSEKAVTQALEEVMRSRTTLFIAHRLTTAARADRILVLSKGEVLETGSHAELLKANSTYAALFRAFSGGVLS
jgi:subfamily B ATP-binding cassette protein MsbA